MVGGGKPSFSHETDAYPKIVSKTSVVLFSQKWVSSCGSGNVSGEIMDNDPGKTPLVLLLPWTTTSDRKSVV